MCGIIYGFDNTQPLYVMALHSRIFCNYCKDIFLNRITRLRLFLMSTLHIYVARTIFNHSPCGY